MNLGPTDIGLIVLAALLLFGTRKLPELGRSLGQGLREFRRGRRELEQALDPEQPDRPA